MSWWAQTSRDGFTGQCCEKFGTTCDKPIRMVERSDFHCTTESKTFLFNPEDSVKNNAARASGTRRSNHAIKTRGGFL